jgi:hypothetical protein
MMQAGADFIYLNWSGQSAPTPILAATDGDKSMPDKILGKTVHRVKKDTAPLGRFRKATTNPKTSFDVIITPAMQALWASNNNAFLASGCNIPITTAHYTPQTPQEEVTAMTIGYAKNFTVEGGKLYFTADLIGDEAVDLASRNFVSPGIWRAPYIAPNGQTFSDYFYHIALTPVPVFTGQDNFQLASSHASPLECDVWPEGEAELLCAQMAKNDMQNACFTPEAFSMLCSAMPGLDKIPEDQRGAHIVGHLQGRGMLGGSHMHMSQMPAMTKREANLAAQLLGDKVDQVADKLGLDTASHEAFKTALLKLPDGTPNVYLMSQYDEEGKTPCPAMGVLDALTNAKQITRNQPRTNHQQNQAAILASRTSGDEVNVEELSKMMSEMGPSKPGVKF